MSDDKKTVFDKLRGWLCWIIGKLQEWMPTIIVFLGIGMAISFILVMFSDSVFGFFEKKFDTNGKKETLNFLGLGIGGIIALYGLVALNSNLRGWLCQIIDKKKIIFNKLQEQMGIIIIFLIIVLGIGMVIAFISVMFSDYISDSFQKLFGTSGKKETLEFLGLGIGGIIALYGLIALNKRTTARVGKLRRGLFWTIGKWRKYVPIIIFFLGFGVAFVFILVMFSDDVAVFFGKGFGTNEFDTNGKKETLKFLGLGASGIFALYGLVALNKRATAQVEMNKLMEKGHFQDRFKSAVEHLSYQEPSAHISSFYEFFHLAKDEKRYTQSILDILCAHLRHISNLKNPEEKIYEEIKTVIAILFSHEAKNTLDESSYNLQRANLSEFNFQKMEKPKGKVDFSFAKLDNANFNKTDLSGFKFQGSILTGANLQGADLRNAELQDADLRNAELQDADLRNAELRRAVLRNADLREANLENAELWGVKLQEANLCEANLQEADLWEANLQKANLQEANLYKADLLEANLRGADLREADLREADLRRADFRETENLETAALSEAIYDDETKFPEGFDPAAHGMVKYNDEIE